MSDAWIRALVALPFGLAIGSFMTVVVRRVPAGESVLAPLDPAARAAAPRSATATTCRWSRGCSCGAGAGRAVMRISARYPLLELSTAALVVARGRGYEQTLDRGR